MSTNFENRERKGQRERESKATGERRSTTKELERDRKNKGDIFCWRKSMKFCSCGEIMRNVKKSEQEHVHFLHKTCNQEASGSFTL